MSCLPCAAQSHPQGPGQGRGAPPSDGLFVHGSPLVPAPPVSAPIPLEWARQGQGSPSTPAERTEAKNKRHDLLKATEKLGRRDSEAGGPLVRTQARGQCPTTAHVLAVPRSTPPTPGETGGVPAGRAAPDGQGASADPLSPGRRTLCGMEACTRQLLRRTCCSSVGCLAACGFENAWFLESLIPV